MVAENLWKKSGDPKKRAEAYKAHQKAQERKESSTKNVVRTSVWQNLRGKDGTRGK